MRTLPSAALAATVAFGGAWVAELSAQVTPAPLVLTSTAFKSGEPIPAEHAQVAGSRNLSPPLQWTAAPPGTATFALILEADVTFNPFNPGMPLVGWIVYGIPGSATGLPKGMRAGKIVKGPLGGTTQGFSDWDRRVTTGGGIEDSPRTAEYQFPYQRVMAPMGSSTSQKIPRERSRIMKPVFPPSVPKYRGPFSPAGDNQQHRFTLYALDAVLPLPEGLDKEQLLAAIDGHVLGTGALTGTFRR